MYPEEYSLFLRKRDAASANDPNGDIVFAEDVNELQAAIERLERHIGTGGTTSIEKRLSQVNGVARLMVPTFVSVTAGALTGSASEAARKLNRFDGFISESVTGLDAVMEMGRQTLYVDTLTLTLGQVQEWIGAARQKGMMRVFLDGLGTKTRPVQQQLVDSAHQVGMSVTLKMSVAGIIDTTYHLTNNPEAKALALHETDTVIVELSETTANGIAGQLQPYLGYRREKKVSLWLQMNGLSEEGYARAQGIGLLYGLDAVLIGEEPLASVPTGFPWVPYLGEWRTMDPLVFSTQTGIERNIVGGRIHLDLTTNKVTFPGLSLESKDIVFKDNDLDGTFIKDGTVTKEKITSLDPEMVTQAVNEGTTKIHIDRIEDLNWEALPGNIPAQNMRTHVIEALNERAGVFGQPEHIVDAAIAGMDASKLSGHVARERMVQSVIQAINTSTNGHIDVQRIDVDTLNAIDIVTQNADAQSLIATEAAIPDLQNERMTSTQRIDAKDIYAQYIKTIQLETDTLKVKDAFIEDLISARIQVETLNAVMAHIGTAEINNLVAESIRAQIVRGELISSINSMIGQATIDGAIIGDASIVNAQIVGLDAVKINAGSINTGLVTLDSPDGHLRISDETIRIYDGADGQGTRRLRTLLGNTGEIVPGSYGLVVLGEDGTTRLYDNTGVYNAGIHQNAISNEKLQDDSVNGRVIMANSILAKHITAEAVTAEKIKAGEVNALHIAAGTITAGSAIIADAAIGSAKISELHGSKIIADSIEGASIKAGSVTADRLSIGFQANQMKEGMDDFETFEVGSTPFYIVTAGTVATVSDDIRRNGTRAMRISGNQSPNRVFLHGDLGPMSGMLPGKEIIVSAYVYTTDATGLDIAIGLRYDGGTLWSNPTFVRQSDGFVRLQHKVTGPEGFFRGTVAIETRKANAPVYVDCVMFEEADENESASVWVPASRTTITGDMISTGTINASKGITFQAGAVVIDENGLRMNQNGKFVQINGNGLIIDGGSLVIQGGLSADQIRGDLVSKWDSASETIEGLVDGNMITVYEKFGTEKEFERVKDRKDHLFAQATVWELSGHALVTGMLSKVTALETYLYSTPDLNNNTPILSVVGRTKDSQVDGALFALRFNEAYQAMLAADNHISSVIQEKTSETAQMANAINQELKSFGADGVLDRMERKRIRERIQLLIGEAPGGALPNTTSIDGRTTGEYAKNRQAARQAGVRENDPAYTGVSNAWSSFSGYMNSLTTSGLTAWDVTEARAEEKLVVNGESLRVAWANLYESLLTLQSRTAQRTEEARQEAERYADSYRDQLVLNGYGDLGNNRNFSLYDYVTDSLTGKGGFRPKGTGERATDDVVPIEQDKAYRLNVAVKSTASTGTYSMGVRFYNAAGTSLGVRSFMVSGSANIPNTTGWTRRELYVAKTDVPANAVGARFYFNGTTANTVSDVSMARDVVESGRDYNGVVFDPVTGMTITSTRNQVRMNASLGLRIQKNADMSEVFKLDANTGDLTITGNINMLGGTISWEQINKPSAQEIGAATLGELEALDGKVSEFEGLTTKVGTVTVINGSMIQSGMVKGDYLDAKNLVVRNGSNVETLKVDSSGNVTINGVVTIQSGSNVYTKTESNTAVKNSTDTAFAADQGLAMKIGYSTYATATANNIYFHGFNWDATNSKYVPADVNGRMLGPDNITFVTLNKGRLNLSSGVPAGASGLIIYDTGVYWFVVWDKTTGIYTKYNVGVTGHTTAYTFSTSTNIVGELEM